MEQSPNQPLRCLTVQNEDTTRLARDTFGVFLRFTSEAAFSIPPPDPRHPYPNTPTPSLVPSISNISLSHLNSAFFPSCRIGVVLAAVGMPFSRMQIPVTSPITRRVLDEDVHAIYQKRNKALGHGYQLSEARDIFDIHDNNMSDVGLVVGLKYFRAAFTLTVVADKIWRIGLAKMAQSTSYYVKNIFSSSYGSDRPSFFIWYPKGTPASEKKLLHKIDFFILTYGCLAFFTKWLDQANLSNAYVSGMREDLEMFGTEFNLAVTCFQIGQILGPIPANLMLSRVRPRVLLPGLEFLWGILTIGTYAVTSHSQLYPIRFLVGFLEGSCFVGIQYCLGSWYKKTELGKRTAIFACSAYVGTMVSGYLQSAMIANMDGRNGLEAWRWVFIFDGIITIIVALYGYIFFPDTPYNTTAFYLTPSERTRCVERLVEDGREETTDFSWSLFRRAFSTWQLYVLTILWMFWNTTVGKVANTVAQLFFKNDPERKWTLYQVNNIPTSINGFNIVCVLLFNVYIDATGCRMNAVALNIGILLFGTVCLVVWDIPLGLRVVSYMFAGLDGPLSPIYYSWANILTTGDSQVRALTLAVMNSCGAALTTVIQQFLYPVTDAPKFGKGFKASLGFLIGMCVWVVVVRLFEMRTLVRKNDAVAETEVSSELSDREPEPTRIGVMPDTKA